jgi:hypothetical protein
MQRPRLRVGWRIRADAPCILQTLISCACAQVLYYLVLTNPSPLWGVFDFYVAGPLTSGGKAGRMRARDFQLRDKWVRGGTPPAGLLPGAAEAAAQGTSGPTAAPQQQPGHMGRTLAAASWRRGCCTGSWAGWRARLQALIPCWLSCRC